jgi:flagellar M-ring protein FliF
MERKVNWQRAQLQMITDHIKVINGIDNANVQIVWPTDTLFASEQNPVTASVTITPSPGSDISTNRAKIEGIQKLLQFAVEGLQPDGIGIFDRSGVQLNDFPNRLAADRQDLIEREQKFIKMMETHYRGAILSSIQQTFSRDRVRDLNIKIDMDMSKTSVEKTEILPIMLKEPTPGLPYDDSIRVSSITISEATSETTWKGSGFNPEGPAGVEPNVPPVFKDMTNLWGEMTQTTKTHNEKINEEKSQIEKSPQIDRVTVSVNIDGKWERKFDAKGKPVVLSNGTIEREYTPVPDEDLRKAETLIRNAIGYNSARGDSVTVRNIPFDRTAEFKAEDEAYFRAKQLQTTIIVFISGLILLSFGFIMFRMISREMERRRRLAEEERARREQMLRESAMAEAEQEGMDVSISLEERTRMELMESAINLAKEHPEDAAQLIRTWLLDE